MSDLKTILLVEDNANDVALALAALEEAQHPHDIIVVSDGQQALDYLYRRGAYASRPERLPNVVLLDLKLPKVDGIEVLARIKQDEGLRMLPIVMLTSSREEKDLSRCYALGANAYVVKPVVFSDYVSTLQSLGLFWTVLNQPPPPYRSGPGGQAPPA